MAQRKALIGESNYAEFEILNDFLGNRGFSVHWVKNGHDAIEQFESIQPDLMILDALLPGKTGLKVAQKLRADFPDAKFKAILLSTVYKQFKEQYDSRKTVGVDAYAEKPVEVGSLEKLILGLMGRDQPGEPIEESDKEIAGDKKSVGPSGTFETTAFPKILYFLKKYKRTGALEVEQDKINKVIYVQAGNLAFVSSNQSSESLGRYMVQSGMLSVADYNSSLESMLKTGKQQGPVLLEMNVTTPHQLFDALRGHLMEKVLSVFAWDKGRYRFRGGRVKLDTTLAVEVDLMDVISQGIRRFFPLSRLEGYFNDYKNKRILRSENGLFEQGLLPLRPSEASFLKSIDGDSSMGRIVARSKMPLTETFQLLYYLLLIEQIRIEGDADLSDRSIATQEQFMAGQKARRQQIREAAAEDLTGQERQVRFDKDVTELFDRIGSINYFDLLGLSRDCSALEVKAAYYRQVQIYHPSENYAQADDIIKAKADGIFRTLTEAYEVLTDNNRKEEYLREIGLPDIEEETVVAPVEPIPEPVTRIEPPPRPAQPKPEPEPPKPAIEEDRTAVSFVKDFDFGEDVSDAADALAESIDPDIEWGAVDDFGEDDGEEIEVNLSFDSVGSEEEKRLEEGRQVTMDMAAIVKSELEFQQGEDMVSEKDFAQAAEHFQLAIEMNPNEAEYHAFLGWTQFQIAPDSEKSLAGAFKCFDRALSINPNQDSAHYFLGMIFLTKGNGEKAKLHLEKALQYNPQHDEAKSALTKLEK